MSADSRRALDALAAAVEAIGGIAEEVERADPRAAAFVDVCAVFPNTRGDAERWQAVGFLARGDDPGYNTLSDDLRDMHRALIRLVCLVDLADGEVTGDADDGALTYRTAFALDEQYRRLGQALDAFKATAGR